VPPPTGGGGPFAFAAPGALEGLLTAAGIRPLATGETRCDFYSPDLATCWRGQAAARRMAAAQQLRPRLRCTSTDRRPSTPRPATHAPRLGT
jgi:hypothetical protein